MKRKQMWILGGGLAVLVIGGLSIAGMRDKGIAVQVATVGRENLQAKVSANGKIQAVTKADISANVMGQVTRLAVKEGDRVHKGQFLHGDRPPQRPGQRRAMQANLQAGPVRPDLRLGQPRPGPLRLRPGQGQPQRRHHLRGGLRAGQDRLRHRPSRRGDRPPPHGPGQGQREPVPCGPRLLHHHRAHGWRRDRPPHRAGRDRRARHPEPAPAPCCSPSPT